MVNLWFYTGLLFVLTLINAFLSMSEVAIMTLKDSKIKEISQENNKTSKIILNIINESSKFVSTIRIGITLIRLLASVTVATVFSKYIVNYFKNLGFSDVIVRFVCIIIITFILAFLMLVFGEYIPKIIAVYNYERISFAVAKPILFIHLLEKPFVSLLSLTTNTILKALKIDTQKSLEEIIEEELRMMMNTVNESGTIEKSEKDMINNIFEFDNRTAYEIMTHRINMTAVEINASLEEIIALAVKDGRSRIPVYNENLDNIAGILYVKDLLGLILEKPKDFDVSKYMRNALFVPETNHCKELFQQFKDKKIQMAIVVDEYGGTSGLVTMEDLIESIVGNIQDEYDDEIEEISQVSTNIFIIEGITSLDDVEKLFNIKLSEDDDYDTIGGYIIDQIGHIPSENEHPVVSIEGINFTVLNMDERRISKIRAEKIIPTLQMNL